LSPTRHDSDPGTPSPKQASTPLITYRIESCWPSPLSRNRSRAVQYLIPHLYTPHTADLRFFASSHYAHSQVYFTPRCSLPHSAFRVPVYYGHRVHIACPNPHAKPALGHGVRELLPPVCSTHRSLSSAVFFTSARDSVTPAYTLPFPISRRRIISWRRRIIAWRRQGTFLLAYHNTLVETCNTKKEKLLGPIPAYPEALVDAATYQSRSSPSVGELIYCGGSLPGCSSHRASPQTAFTTLYLRTLPTQRGSAYPALPKLPQSQSCNDSP
jgi:hypothetical protein